jgi:hypothetical protein
MFILLIGWVKTQLSQIKAEKTKCMLMCRHWTAVQKLINPSQMRKSSNILERQK